MAKLSELKHGNKQNNVISKPLFKLERKSNYIALIIFACVMSVLLVAIIALYPTLKESMAKLLETMDPAMKEMFGKLIGMESASEYFTMQGSQIWGLLAVIYTSYLAYKLVVSGFRDGSAEMLYTSNLSRGKVLRTKLLRLLINVVILNTVCGIVSFAGLMIIDAASINIGLFVAYYAFITLMCLQIGAFVFGLCCIFKGKFNLFLAIALPLVFFFIGSIALIDTSVSFLNYFTPFAIAYSNLLSVGLSAINWGSFVVWAVIPAALLGYSYYQFKNSDLII